MKKGTAVVLIKHTITIKTLIILNCNDTFHQNHRSTLLSYEMSFTYKFSLTVGIVFNRIRMLHVYKLTMEINLNKFVVFTRINNLEMS